MRVYAIKLSNNLVSQISMSMIKKQDPNLDPLNLFLLGYGHESKSL